MKILIIIYLGLLGFITQDPISESKSLITQGQYQEAITLLSSCQDIKARYFEGWCYYKMGDCSNATQELTTFINTYQSDNSEWIVEAQSLISTCSDEVGSASIVSTKNNLNKKELIATNFSRDYKKYIESLDVDDGRAEKDIEIGEMQKLQLFYTVKTPNSKNIDIASISNSYILCQGVAHENIWESRMRTAANSEQPNGVAYENIWESRMRTAQNETNQHAKGVAHENIWESKMIAAPSGQDVNYHICNGVAHENIWESKMIAPPGSSITDLDESDDDLPTGTKHETVWESKMISSPSGDPEIHIVICNGVAHENIWESKMRIDGGVPSDIMKIRGVKHETIWESRMRTASSETNSEANGVTHENIWESKMIAGPSGDPEIVNIICNHESHFHAEEETIADFVRQTNNSYILCQGVSHENIWESRMRTAANGEQPFGVAHENIWESRMRTAPNETNPNAKGVAHENIWESKMIAAPNGQDVTYHICNGVAHENIWESKMIAPPGSSITDLDESDDDLPTGTKHETVWESKMISSPSGDQEIHVVICNGVAHENIWESKMRIAGGVPSDIIKIRGVKHETIWENKEMRTSQNNSNNTPTGTKHETVWESKMIAGPNGEPEIINVICNHGSHFHTEEEIIVKNTMTEQPKSNVNNPMTEQPSSSRAIDYSTSSSQHHYKILFSIENNPDKEYLSLSSIGPVTSKEANAGNFLYYVGFYNTKEDADKALKRVKSAGHPVARIMEFNKGELKKEHKEIVQQSTKDKIESKEVVVSEPIQKESKTLDQKATPQIEEVEKSEVLSYHILFRILDNPFETFDELKSIGPLYRETFDDKGNSRYLIGNTDNIDEAKDLLAKVKKAGYKASFIAEYKDGSLNKILQE